MTETPASWVGKQVLVTGGLGFVGNTIVRQLVGVGATVRVLDALLPQGGGSPRNLLGIAKHVDVITDDTRSRDAVDRAVRGCDVVFHLAGNPGFSALSPDWYSEIDTACLGTLNVLEAVRVYAPIARVVFVSALDVYAAAGGTLLTEDAPTEPSTLFGVHKLAGEKYCRVYYQQHGVRTVIARVASLFGPRQRLTGAANGTIANAIDAAIHGEPLLLPDNDKSLLDILFVDDAARAIIALALASGPLDGSIVNVGRGTGITLSAFAELLITAVGGGVIQQLPAEPTHDASRLTDVRKLRSVVPDWTPGSLADDLARTVRWYRGGDDAA